MFEAWMSYFIEFSGISIIKWILVVCFIWKHIHYTFILYTFSILQPLFVRLFPKKYWMCSVTSFRCYCAKWTRIFSKKLLFNKPADFDSDLDSYKIYETLNVFGRWKINWLFKGTGLFGSKVKLFGIWMWVHR